MMSATGFEPSTCLKFEKLIVSSRLGILLTSLSSPPHPPLLLLRHVPSERREQRIVR